MAEPVVTLELGWTYGVAGPDGRKRYYGPGSVTVPLSVARSLGYEGGNVESSGLPTTNDDDETEEEDVAQQIYRWQGERYTVATLPGAPREFLALLQHRGQLPAGVAVPEDGGPLLEDVQGIGPDLAGLLRDEGYATVAELAATDPEALEKLPGIGGKTAPRLVEAAASLLEAEPEDGA